MTCPDALKEIKEQSYLTLFSRLRSRALTVLTRQSTGFNHTENESSLFSCLVSPLPSSLLSVSVFFLCLCLRVVLWSCCCGVVWCPSIQECRTLQSFWSMVPGISGLSSIEGHTASAQNQQSRSRVHWNLNHTRDRQCLTVFDPITFVLDQLKQFLANVFEVIRL